MGSVANLDGKWGRFQGDLAHAGVAPTRSGSDGIGWAVPLIPRRSPRKAKKEMPSLRQVLLMPSTTSRA